MGGYSGEPGLAVVSKLHGAGPVRPARVGLRGQEPDQERRHQAGHCPRVGGEEPCQRCPESQGHLRKAVTMDQSWAPRSLPGPWACLTAAEYSDGSACAIVTTPEIAKKLGKKDIHYVKAAQLAVSNGLKAASTSGPVTISSRQAVQHRRIQRGRRHQSEGKSSA